MQRDSEPNYYGTLQVIGARANMMVEEICEDLQKHIKLVRSIPSDHRSFLAKQVQALYDICRMGGVICSRSSECVSILNLSGLYVSVNPFSSDAAVQNAVRKIKNNSDFFASECVDMIQQAADWSISFAAGSNEKKRAFLEDISQGKGKDFLQEVLDEYRSSSGTADTRGRCGYSIGSRDYREYVERTVFWQELSTLGSYDYDGIIKGALEVIADQLERDLTRNERENNYITDDTARSLKEAVRDLNRCDVSTGSAESTIERLAWFVGGDPAKIRQLQSKLNALGIGERLEEDGVYGAKTDKAVETLFDLLRRGTFPTIACLDPLQSKATKIYSRSMQTEHGWIDALHDLSERSQNKKGDITVFRVDVPDNSHPYYHINTVAGKNIKDKKYIPTPRQKEHINNWNHTKISESAYKLLKNFDSVARLVRIGGTALLVAGEVRDVIELCKTIEPQLHDAGKKLDKETWSSIASMGGSWTFSAAASKIGALTGAKIGTAIMPGIGTAIGGVTGGAVLGVVGAAGGDWLGRWVVDVTVLEE